MATPTRFVVGLLALLAVPAAVIVLPSANVADAFSHFPGNYLFMAWPNLAVALLAVWPRFRCRGLLYSIATLNAVLIGFALWVRLAVPARESGLAWVILIVALPSHTRWARGGKPGKIDYQRA